MPDKTITPPNDTEQAPRFLRRKSTAERLGVSLTTLDDWRNPKAKRYRPDFPKAIKVANGVTCFLESEINAYVLKLANECRVS